MLRRLFAFILRPLFFLGLRFMDWEPWERLHKGVAPPMFGLGSRHGFRWYFEGESIVPAKNIEAICDWLAECEYVRDPDLFHEPDYWQHPNTFEQLRKGDCEDHALWAWRKLTELGIPAEFYVGRWRTDANKVPGFHAWVVCKYQGAEYILETTADSRDTILLPIEQVRQDYFPHFAVDAQFNSCAFGGYMLYWKAERDKRRRKPAPQPA